MMQMPLTSYSLASSSSDAVYPYFIFPEQGTPIYPARPCGRRPLPVAESLAARLKGALEGKAFRISTAECFKFSEGGCVYPADITIIDGAGIALDVEIDEPYTTSSHIARHYLDDSSDSLRDDLLRRRGWAVMRIGEKQAAEFPDACCQAICSLLRLAASPDARQATTLAIDGASLPPQRKFSRISADKNAEAGMREAYLRRAGFEPADAEFYYDDAPLTSEELACAEACHDAPAACGSAADDLAGYNARNASPRDADIVFIPETHTYLYKHTDALKSVTTAVSEFFPKFDATAMAERKAKAEGRKPQEYIDKWNYASRKAAETGTHMHAQIEKYLLGEKTNSSMRLRFEAETMRADEWVDVSRELAYFRDFIGRAGLTPYRTEWPIYDTETRMAGSPDLIAEKDGRLMMFDWKRSTKVIDAAHCRGINGAPSMQCWGRYGQGPLAPLPDCAFVHYSLQQAMYKRILEKNYGIRLDRTFLVVLHPQYAHFYIVETMNMDKYIDHIFRLAR